MRFIAGVLVGWAFVAAAVFVYFKAGFVPAAVAAEAMPLEKTLAGWGLEAHVEKQAPKNVPIAADDANLTAGAKLYAQHCAHCHGLPERSSPMRDMEYPRPPQLFHGKGVTDDPPGETYWKVENGIRLTGMPAFNHMLNQTEMWQVSLLCAHANKLPAAAQQVLNSAPAPAP
jgi:thiosulfate dehydrogenase